jgi:uncharacterized membrane protein HdeD (DUF308 family)
MDEHEVSLPWYLPAIAGVVSLVIGVVVLAYPEPSLKLLAVFLGIDLLIVGLTLIVGGAARGAGAPAVVLGVVALIGGVIVLRHPGNTVAVLALALSIYLIAAGALDVGRALATDTLSWRTIGRGALLVAAGTLIVAWPDISLKTFALLAGLALLVQAAVDIGEAYVLREERRLVAHH